MFWAQGQLTGDELWACTSRDKVIAALIERMSMGEISLNPNPQAARLALAIAVTIDLEVTKPGLHVVVRPIDDPEWVRPHNAIVLDARSNGRLLAGLVATGLLSGGRIDSEG